MAWCDFIKHVQDTYKQATDAFNPEAVKIGDVLEFYHGGHEVRVRVTKINRKSWGGVQEGGYNAGCEWRVSKDTSGLRMKGSVHLKTPEDFNVSIEFTSKDPE